MKNWRGAIDCGLDVLCRKKGKEWMLKLKVVYPFVLNDRIEDKGQCKSDKECEDLIEKAFPSLPRIMQRDNNVRHRNRKSQIILNHKLLIKQFI